jgi:hypothetical protein
MGGVWRPRRGGVPHCLDQYSGANRFAARESVARYPLAHAEGPARVALQTSANNRTPKAARAAAGSNRRGRTSAALARMQGRSGTINPQIQQEAIHE